ncbi:MAG: hypothetical protein HC869_13570 [Rhodospirillales bacterium]|nr:hypothetical protein [Rhodospirillales bacterium]
MHVGSSIPRDVVVSAQLQWLPNLGTEMAGRPSAASAAKPSPPAQADRQTPAKSAPEAPKAAAAQPEAAPRKADIPNADPGRKTPTADEPPQARAAGQTDDLLHPTEEELRGSTPPRAPAVRGYTAYAGPDGGKQTLSASEQPRAAADAGMKGAVKVAQAKAADQTDDLLFPDGGAPDAAGRENSSSTANSASPPSRAAPVDAAAPTAPGRAAEPQTRAAPAIGIESDVDPENWAEYGGWYRQDYAIFYRPIGHKDKFIYSWLFLTGPHAPKGDRSPAAAVFDFLTGKDAQGSCTKCHSVDDSPGKGRRVNFSPPSVKTKQGRFTSFIHEPHFGVMEKRGCLTCHNLEKGRPYLKSYEQGNPQNFISNFGAVKKDLCQTCHTSNLARQDCLLCHKYHVNGVVTPIINTRIRSNSV